MTTTLAASGRYATVGILTLSMIGLAAALPAQANTRDYTVTIQNISQTIVTPPVIALTTEEDLSFFEVGAEASEELEELAEGGATGALADLLRDAGANVTEHDAPLGPGEEIELEIDGRNRGYLHLAAMLLPTNDAFAALDGERIRGRGEHVFYAKAYDAGTEDNTELDSDIPGPFGGEGFNSDRDDYNFIYPHPGLHGEGDQALSAYDWQGPVLKITVERNR